MAEKKYYIQVSGSPIAVTREVYQAYYQEERRARSLEEKDRRNALTHYSALDSGRLSGEELLPDREAVSVEDAAIANILREKLRRCIALLPKPEQELIYALYFENLSERQLAEKLGLHYMTIHNKKAAALRKLKKFF